MRASRFTELAGLLLPPALQQGQEVSGLLGTLPCCPGLVEGSEASAEMHRWGRALSTTCRCWMIDDDSEDEQTRGRAGDTDGLFGADRIGARKLGEA